MQFDIEEKKEFDAINILLCRHRHFQLEIKTVQFPISVPVVLETLELSFKMWFYLNGIVEWRNE